jgi:hypothetical protein
MIWEVLEAAAKERKNSDKVIVLQHYKCAALTDVLRGFYDKRVQFDLPKGEAPPYSATDESPPSNLMRKNIMFKYFVKGTPDCRTLGQVKKEKLFVQLLESVHIKDSQLLVSMINKEKIPKLSSKLILEAFPGLYQ